jgi:hypothetical protein
MKVKNKPLSIFLMFFFGLSAMQPVGGFAQDPEPSLQHTPALRDGQHDFDFNFGNWKTHILRRLHPFTANKDMMEMNGTVSVQKIWNGRASIEVIEADGPQGHFEGTTLFLYNPASHQWSQNFAFGGDADISNPTIGEFKDGRGELYGQETEGDRHVLVRGVWANIRPDSHTYEESISEDGGKTFVPVFSASLVRDRSASAEPWVSGVNGPAADTARPGEHEFDFAPGTWKEHSTRLLHPLTGSTTWEKMEGMSVVHQLWNGRGNLTELESDGPDGHLELLALRLYNPEAHQWNLTFATSKVGVLGMPQNIGEFKNGIGQFYDQESYKGKAIWVRFTITPISKDAYRSEQAFSDDAGKTWETNWINSYERAKD